MVKVCELDLRQARSARRRDAGSPYDLVVLDAPATGHALAMLRSPQTFAAIVRVGPDLAEQARRVRELLEDPQRCGYVAVTHADARWRSARRSSWRTGLRPELGRDFDAVVVNGTLPRRFTRESSDVRTGLDGNADELGLDRRRCALYSQRRRGAAQDARTGGLMSSRVRSRACDASASPRADPPRAARRFPSSSCPGSILRAVGRHRRSSRARSLRGRPLRLCPRRDRSRDPEPVEQPSSPRQSRRTRTDRSRCT